MISIKKCRELLGARAKGLTDEQIEGIRKVLIELARLNVKIIEEHNNKNDEESSNNE